MIEMIRPICVDDGLWPDEWSYLAWFNEWLSKVIETQHNLKVLDLMGCLDSGLL